MDGPPQRFFSMIAGCTLLVRLITLPVACVDFFWSHLLFALHQLHQLADLDRKCEHEIMHGFNQRMKWLRTGSKMDESLMHLWSYYYIQIRVNATCTYQRKQQKKREPACLLARVRSRVSELRRHAESSTQINKKTELTSKRAQM